MKRQMKRMLTVMVCSLFVLIGLLGCSKQGSSKETLVKKALKDKYDEDFIIHEIDNWGSDCKVTASPQKNPEILFQANILSDGTVGNDDYYRSYAKYLLEGVIEKDIEGLFPDSYIRMREVYIRWEGGEDENFRNMDVEELLDSSFAVDAPGGNGCYLDIFVNKEACENHYEQEYDFFTNKIEEYIKENKMLPITVTIFYVNHEVLSNLREYFKKDIDIDTIFARDVLNVDFFTRGVVNSESVDLGSPPNVVFCFKKDSEYYIRNYEEYRRKRELLENEQ